MKRIRCIAGLATLSALIASSPALAGACAGIFVRDLPSYDNRNDTGALERVGDAAASRLLFVALRVES